MLFRSASSMRGRTRPQSSPPCPQPSGGIAREETPSSVTVSTRLARPVLGITDTGTGISPEDLPHIFERFYKSHGTNSVKNQSGSGLGLTISKEIIEAHGGTINVKSTFGKGTSFYFTIPIYED